MSSSNRIIKLFNNNPNINKKLFVPFLVIGDPNINQFLSIVTKITPYFDILELGIPFSDPIADGPTIQEANLRAFKAGVNTEIAFEIIKKVRKITDKPILILTYYNILIQGTKSIETSLDLNLKKLSQTGVDGIIIVDLPIEESELALKYCKKYNLILIFLIAPTTTNSRLKKILEVAEGFLYLVSIPGITGARKNVAQITKDTILRLKLKNKTKIPIFIGFGISKPEHAAIITKLGADGVIIGSAIIDIIKENLKDYKKMEYKIVEFVASIKKAIN